LRPKPLEDPSIVVSLVNISDVTRALHHNQHPQPNHKMLPTPPLTPAPKPPEPQKQAPTPPPPPQTASAPQPTPPTPADQPPKPTPIPPPPTPTPTPKPAPQPQVKPSPPKKAEKQPPKKQEKKPPQKSHLDSDFDSMLKNVENIPAPPDTEKTPPRHIYRPAQEQEASSENMAQIGEQLSTSELDAVKEQVRQCWSPPVGAKGEDQMIVVLQMTMNQDGTVISDTVVEDGGKYGSDPVYTALADSVVRAFGDPGCNPLKLPADKYDEWKSFTFTFNPQDY
jgi:hypothetical protein